MSWGKAREYLGLGLTALSVVLALMPPGPPVRVVRVPPRPRASLGSKGSGDRVAEAAELELAISPETREELEADIEEYWLSFGLTPAEAARNVRDNVPWSGAFIQFVVDAGAPGSLLRSAAHSTYGAAAKERALRWSGAEPVYKAYPPNAIAEPAVGDIVLKPRPGDERTFSELGNSFPAHGDVIVAVRKDAVVTIGGNKIGGKVGAQEYARLSDGTLALPIFAVLRLSDGPPVKYYADKQMKAEWFRRARESEVTDTMRSDAKAALSYLVLGEAEHYYGETSKDDYVLVAETHGNAPKGISVFVRDEGVA